MATAIKENDMKKMIKIGILLLFSFFCNGCGSTALDTQDLAAMSFGEETTETEIATESVSQAEIYVYVCGEVCNPGVYVFPKEARVYEAIEAAGGLTAYADASGVNQADVLNDGMMIDVPKHVFGTEEEDDGLVNINTASEEELMTLSGIGQSKAKAIISYRTQNGPFQNAEDIMQIPGIKEGVFVKIQDSIKV